MGRDYRYRYSVELTLVRGRMTPAGWATRSRVGQRIPASQGGTPTAAKLARYVEAYNASLAPGGVNAHLGRTAIAVAAHIVDHENDRAIVATWEAR